MNIIRNNVQVVGYLGANPEIKTLESGKKVASFRIACSESYTDSEGRKIENTNWFSANAWEGLAGVAEKYMTKGVRVAISGKLVNRSWTGKDGKSRTTTEILVNDILVLGKKD
jgi:single-strand DNA-binding protein